nr:pectinesterase-like [Ipomoea batatas]
MGSNKKSLGVIGMASILFLMAFVVGATATESGSCAPSDTKGTCEVQSIEHQPQDVMKEGFVVVKGTEPRPKEVMKEGFVVVKGTEPRPKEVMKEGFVAVKGTEPRPAEPRPEEVMKEGFVAVKGTEPRPKEVMKEGFVVVKGTEPRPAEPRPEEVMKEGFVAVKGTEPRPKEVMKEGFVVVKGTEPRPKEVLKEGFVVVKGTEPRPKEVMKEGFSLDSIADAIGKSEHMQESVKALCASTDFKELCEKSLARANHSHDPKKLLNAAFSVAWENLSESMSKSALLKRADKDPRTHEALDICKEVLNHSIEDLKRSSHKVEESTTINVEHGNDLKVWLSAAITFEETCLDAFQNTTGDTGEKMRHLLKTAMELTSNALAMLTKLTELLKTLEIPGFSRRLLEDAAAVDSTGEFPKFVDAPTRRLLTAPPSSIKPDMVVSKDGSGKFNNINAALATIPPKSNRTVIILIKAGVYSEYVVVPRKVNNVVFMGEGPGKTVITGNKNFIDGVGTYKTATVVVEGEGFVCRDLTIENRAGAAKHQAVALRVSADMAVFHNCNIEAYQDTLYAHSYRQFYRGCTITDTIDFIFGDAAAVFQNCKMIVRKPMENQACMVTAQGRKDSRSVGGTVLQACEILPDPALKGVTPPVKVYLGRPWKEFSRTIIMSSFIDGFIAPEGWSPWQGDFALNTLWYAEYGNRGPGANTASRVKWGGYKKNISPEIAKQFSPSVFLEGDAWIKRTAAAPIYVWGVKFKSVVFAFTGISRPSMNSLMLSLVTVLPRFRSCSAAHRRSSVNTVERRGIREVVDINRMPEISRRLVEVGFNASSELHPVGVVITRVARCQWSQLWTLVLHSFGGIQVLS